MKKISCLFFPLFLSIFAQAQPAKDIVLASSKSGNRLALVVGNSDYESEYVNDLKNSLNDADSMALALYQLGWEVMLLKNVDLRSLEFGLEQFYGRLSSGIFEAGLFYFSGHGFSINGVNYLVPTNAKPISEKDVKYECLDANRALSIMEGQTPVKILILDACRNNPFARAWKSTSTQDGLSFMQSPKGTFIGFAAAPGEKASDGRIGSNGLYTAALLKHLRTQGLSIDQIFTRVAASTQEFASAEGWDQTPFKNSSLTADFFFGSAIDSVPSTPKSREQFERVQLAIRQKDFDAAIQTIQSILQTGEEEEKAEARFLLAEAFYYKRDLVQAEKTCEQCIQENGDFPFWIAKCFILLSDIYADQGNPFSARAVLELLIENYSGDENLIKEAKAKLGRY